MREYHLSYDITDTEKYDPTKVKRHIVAHLLNNDITDITSPVASTLIFLDTTIRGKCDSDSTQIEIMKESFSFWYNLFKSQINNSDRNIVYFHISSTQIFDFAVLGKAFTAIDEVPSNPTSENEFKALLNYVSNGRISKILKPNYVNRH